MGKLISLELKPAISLMEFSEPAVPAVPAAASAAAGVGVESSSLKRS